MSWTQIQFRLAAKPRGFHLVTREILDYLSQVNTYRVGLLHLFIQHTSAALTLNENADRSVRVDMNRFFDQMVPDDTPYFTHTYEGPDDMSAHIKTVLVGESVSIPIRNGRLALGTWQGIYLCEYRDAAHGRSIMATIQGELS